MNKREKDLFFETLELLRKVTEKPGQDFKDRDDWLFSNLGFTRLELAEIYEGRGVMVYTGSAVQDDMNTLVEYLYRDACNYKNWNRVVVKGSITPEQIDTIMDCLIDGEYFIPNMVGLDEEKFSDWTEDDVDFFEIHRTNFTPTKCKPSVNMTVAELVSKFQIAKGHWQ